MDMDSGTGEAPSIRPLQPRKRGPLPRIYHLLVSRLSAPLLASLILLPILPSSNRHFIFELVPFYKTLKCLLSTPSHASNTQQWLSYWAIYASVRFLEGTRCNVSTKLQRREALHNALEKLPRMLGERVLRLFSIARRRTSTTTTSEVLARDMTLATQLAGSSTRWIVIKAILLFYAMDEELQGARRIMQKVIKPFFGFFTSLDEEYDDSVLSIYPSHQQHPARRTSISGTPLKLNLEEEQAEDKHEVEVDEEHTRSPETPELSMDGSCGGSDEECVEGRIVNDMLVIKQDVLGSHHAATWPSETRLIAVEGNQWVR